jgi:hypothetical protein
MEAVDRQRGVGSGRLALRRRNFIGAAVAALAAMAEQSFAQQPGGKMPRVGILTPAPNDRTPIFEAFKQGFTSWVTSRAATSSSNSARTAATPRFSHGWRLNWWPCRSTLS